MFHLDVQLYIEIRWMPGVTAPLLYVTDLNIQPGNRSIGLVEFASMYLKTTLHLLGAMVNITPAPFIFPGRFPVPILGWDDLEAKVNFIFFY